VPLDRSYIADAKNQPAPLAAGTCTDHDGIKTGYVFAFNRPGTPGDEVQFSPAELGLAGRAYVYDYFSGTGGLLKAKTSFSAPLGENASGFYIVAPVGRSGIAFLGDKNKFVGTGKQRIESLQDQAGRLTVGVVLAENEKSVVLHGYAATAPKVTVNSGSDDAVQYDPATHHFTVEVQPDAAAPVDYSAADPVRHLTVVLETQAE